MNNSDFTIRGEDEKASAIAYVAATIALTSIGVTGFFFNLLAIVVIVKESSSCFVPVNIVLLNLTGGDMLMALLGIPLSVVSALNEGYSWNHSTCIWYAWLMSTLGFASIINLTVMAVERWFLIALSATRMSPRLPICMVIFVWIYVLSLSMPPLFGWGRYGPEAANISCSVLWDIQDPDTHTRSYILYIFTFGLVVPLVIIIASYISIIMTVRSIKIKLGSKRRREIAIAKMVAIMVFAFLFAWSPYAVMALAAQFFSVKMSPGISMLPAIFAKSSICYNPIIYTGTNLKKHIRKFTGMTREKPASAVSATAMSRRVTRKTTPPTLGHEKYTVTEIQ